MRGVSLLLLLASFLVADARPAPGAIETTELEDFDKLDPARQELVKVSLEETARLKISKYLYGSADPSRGGFDCSGAVFYLLKKVGLEPARSSAAQYEWLKEAGTLHVVPEGAGSLDDAAFDALEPGDLVFWAGTYQPKEPRPNKITHVQIYLGVEKDGGPVMVGSSDGRSYRGQARCGFGVFDFKLPRKGSKARLVGYGKPPGLGAE